MEAKGNKMDFMNMIRKRKIEKIKNKLKNLSAFTSIIEEVEEESEQNNSDEVSAKLSSGKGSGHKKVSKQNTLIRSQKKYDESSFFRSLKEGNGELMKQNVLSQHEKYFNEIIELTLKDPKYDEMKLSVEQIMTNPKLLTDIDPELQGLVPQSLTKRASNMSSISGDVLKQSNLKSFQRQRNKIQRQSTVMSPQPKVGNLEEQTIPNRGDQPVC